MPASWKAYGVDGNNDGLMDPYNPVDAIFAAARYLKAAGADTDIRKAVFAYNHADWYVDSVLLRAQVIGGLPSNLVGSLTGLTEGRFPVAAKASYANQVSRRGAEDDEPQPLDPARRRQPPRPGDLRRRRLARGRGQRRAGDQDRRLGAARPLRPGPGRLRQHVHLRQAGQDLQALRRAQAAEGGPGRGQADAGRAARRQGAQGRGLGHRPARLARDATRSSSSARPRKPSP